jgi:cell division protein FtsQ
MSSSRRVIPGLRRLVGVLVAIALLAGVAAVVYFTPLLSVRTIEVDGAKHVTEEQVVPLAAPLRGLPLLQVRGPRRETVAAKITELSPWIESTTLTTTYPSTLTVQVIEREAVAWAQYRGSVVLVDSTGLPFLKQPAVPPLTPKLTVAEPSSKDENTKVSLAVLSSLPQDLRGQVVEFGATSPADVRLKLRDDRTVLWGDQSNGTAKAVALRAVLTQPGRQINVINPDLPTVR